MKGLGYGQGYQYAHDVQGKVADMRCLPDNLRDRIYYEPTNEGAEKQLRERLNEILAAARRAAPVAPAAAAPEARSDEVAVAETAAAAPEIGPGGRVNGVQGGSTASAEVLKDA